MHDPDLEDDYVCDLYDEELREAEWPDTVQSEAEAEMWQDILSHEDDDLPF